MYVCMYTELCCQQVDTCAGTRFRVLGFGFGEHRSGQSRQLCTHTPRIPFLNKKGAKKKKNTALGKVDTCAGTPRASVSSISVTSAAPAPSTFPTKPFPPEPLRISDPFPAFPAFPAAFASSEISSRFSILTSWRGRRRSFGAGRPSAP